MRVLFVNHTGEISGAEHALLNLVQGLRITSRTVGISASLRDCELRLLCGNDGPLVERARALKVETQVMKPFTAGFTRKPVQLCRYIAKLWESARHVAAIALDWKADIIHANSVRAGLVACVARNGTASVPYAPLVVHIHDCVPRSVMSSLVRRIIGSRAATIIANSAYTRQSFARENERIRKKTRVVYNSFDFDRFDPLKVDATPLRGELALQGAFPVLALVAQITPWKGQSDAVAAMVPIVQSFPRAKLLVVGDAKFQRAAARYDNAAYAQELRELVNRNQLNGHVLFTGERDDIPTVFKASDIALLPSWEEPFGRTIVEAMAMETPAAATNVGGPCEIIEEGVTGRLVPPRNPLALAETVCQMAQDRDLLRQMGVEARKSVVERFSQETIAKQMVDIYASLLRIGD